MIRALVEVRRLNAIVDVESEAGLSVNYNATDFQYAVLDALVHAPYAVIANIRVDVTADNRFVSDVIPLSDLYIVSFSKNISETPVVSEQIDNFDFGKSVSEISQISDLFGRFVSFKRDFSDAFSVTQLQTMEMGKNLSDTGAFTEVQIHDMGKNLTESPAITDSVLKETVFNRSHGDAFDSTDVFERVVSYNRDFTETIYATDDLDGEASLQDDQEMQFTKTRTELSFVSESLDRSVSYNRDFADAYDATDDTVLGVGKVFDNIGDFVDAHSFDVGKALANLANLTESAAIDVTKAIPEQIGVQEAPSKGVGKPTSDALDITDADVLAFGKTQADPVSFADAGSIVSQGYVDNNAYFAEIYVGTSRTF